MNKTEIARIVSAWGIKSFSFRPLNGGMVNENFFIGSDTGTYVLRKLGFLKGLKGLKKELDYLLYLNNQRFKYKVPTPLYITNNALFVENGGHVFWLYRYIDGTIKDNTSYDQIEEIARMTSDYHRLTKSYKKIRVRSATRDPFFRKGIRKFSLSLMPKRSMVLKQEDKMFTENINNLLSILNELNVPGYESLATYPINSDIKYDNLIWKGKKLVGIIDFDNVGRVNFPLVKDLATTIQYCCLIKDSEYKIDMKLAKHFVETYRRNSELSELEVRSIPPLIISSWIDVYNYAYWLIKNGSSRSNMEKLKKCYAAATWCNQNADTIVSALL